MTSEGAFSYLARDFGLKELYLWPINADQQGTPQQVRKVIDAVAANKIPAVFSESTVSDKPAQQVARETGAALWRRALCRLAERGRRPGADLSRPAARHVRDDRQGAHAGTDAMTAAAGDLRAPRRRKRGLAFPCTDATVTYRNGHTALRDASFAIPTGTITALVGVNGSGKSTLFKAIMGFVRLARGEIRMLGMPVAQALRKNLVAYVPADRGGRLELPRPGRGRGDDGPLRPHGHAAHREGGRPRSGRRRRSPASA